MDHLKVTISEPTIYGNLISVIIGAKPTFILPQQLMAAKSDAPFRDAKTKLLEIRARYSQHAEGRTQTKEERRKKKKQKKLDSGHVWS